MGAAASVLKTKVITSPEDRVGVVLYGVKEKINPNGFEGIRVLQELDRSTAQRIRSLEVEAARPREKFEERYGIQAVPLSDVFWTCTTIFNLSANPKQFSPRLFIFTGNDAPCSSITEQDAAETRARDLMDLGVEVGFFPLLPAGRSFSIDRFWTRVVPVDEDGYVDQVAVRMEELERRVRRRVHRKRVLQRLTLELCPGTQISVAIYAHIIEAKIPPPVYLLNENNKPLKSTTRNICEQTGQILHPVDDIETFVEVAGERVFMTRAEVDETKLFGEPGMRLLGFKPLGRLKPHHRVFHSYFVYPMDRLVLGSAALCKALIDVLLERKLMALVRYIPRRKSQPVLAALLPQAEQLDDAGVEQLQAPGFHMIILPWGAEIRENVFPMPEGMPPPSEALLGAARSAIRAMSLDGFVPGCVENPVLQKHYAGVQALALGEEFLEETPDLLQPDDAALLEKAPLFIEWRGLVDSMSDVVRAMMPSKRSATGCEDAPRTRRRTEDARPAEGPTTLEAMRAVVFAGQLERLTLGMLKDWLKAQGISTTGKKADLVERVRACV